MGQKIYIVPIENVTVGTAVQDIFALFSTTTYGVELHHIHLEANVTAEAALRMRLKRGVSGVSQGSGGAVVTPAQCDYTDPAWASQFTVHTNDTTQATGTFQTMAGYFWDVSLPFDDLPAPEDRITSGSGLILDFPATIASTTISGFLKFRLLP